jgi:hypothetical protein
VSVGGFVAAFGQPLDEFPLSAEQKLKVVASEGLAPGQSVSSSDAVAAVLWQSITRARGLDKQPDQVTFPIPLLCPVPRI